MMLLTVQDGTGGAAAVNGLVVGGKTGTAENPHGKPHAWFMGFAQEGKQTLAIAVIVENGGSGGRCCRTDCATSISRCISLRRWSFNGEPHTGSSL